MTGPAHYLAAEKLLHDAPGCTCLRSDCEHEQAMLRRAQVHATLANAAATADLFAHQPEWAEATR